MKTQVLIIGGGITGTGIARDLALRGIDCVLAEYRDINAGASGSNHGLLHSGARYVFNDPPAAQECRSESEYLKKLAPHCIEETGGLFVAVDGDDESYVTDFPQLCARYGIPVRAVDIKEARQLEPALSERLIGAYEVEDASVDPFRLSLDNICEAAEYGCKLLSNTELTGFQIKKGRIRAAELNDIKTGESIRVYPDLVVNATGAWAGNIAALVGISISMMYSKGTLLVTNHRIAKRVLNRLRPPSDADILVPGGTVSILGTTSIPIPSLDEKYMRPTVEEVDTIVSEGAQIAPQLESTRYIRAYAGVRPLLGFESDDNGREISRGFSLFDHVKDEVENFITITGGKLTTYRLMAEKTSDLVCQRLGNDNPCLTLSRPLSSANSCRWTEPGSAPRQWLEQSDAKDTLLCECEMIPKSTIDQIISDIRKQDGTPTLKTISHRSRLGKGPCQGSFCSVRVLAHMYDQGNLVANQGLAQIREFLGERWKGQRAILWDSQLMQAELMEALHCGLFNLELESSNPLADDNNHDAFGDHQQSTDSDRYRVGGHGRCSVCG